MALILSRADVQRCLSMTEAIAAMRVAFSALYNKHAQVPQRTAIEIPHQGVFLCMPSLLESSFGLKVVSVIPDNSSRGLPSIHATVLLADTTTGKTLAVIEGSWLTAMRTGAVSGLATDLLARRDANTLALFGAGAQASTQALAVHTVRPLREVRVVNHNKKRFHQFVATMQTLLGENCPPIRRATAQEALSGATLVCCATSATTPLFQWGNLEPGTHINAIGAFTPTMCEVDAETLAHAHIVVDQREAALSEAGDLLQALEAGRISGPETWIELGDLLTTPRAIRQHDDEITFFKSVGIGVQDVAVAWTLYNKAREQGIGVEVDI